jgi:hypothetical protein
MSPATRIELQGGRVMVEAASATRTVTVNAAFLQEIKEVNQELWQLLAECTRYCDHPIAASRPCSDFVQRLSELCDMLALHFALEEAYGYFDNPLDVAPRLADRCHALRNEHSGLYVEVVNLVDRATQLLYEKRLSQLTMHVPNAFRRFHQNLLDHEAREMELIQEAFARDLGVGD